MTSSVTGSGTERGTRMGTGTGTSSVTGSGTETGMESGTRMGKDRDKGQSPIPRLSPGGVGTRVTPCGWQHRGSCSLAGTGQEVGPAPSLPPECPQSVPSAMTDNPDLYETLEIRYPPPRARGDPGRARPPPAARSPRCHACHRALGTGVLLLLAAATAALGALYAQSRAELRAARAALAAATDPLGPDPDGDIPSAAQRRQDRLGG
ncbi:uncharacterized protein LOC134552478 [Prinia subflava]|uniref:uncharacterized protein LOC134552478 n=1 Tax=Prinia subflava TaxID=208062 RepID=UPI002FE0E950